MPIHKKFEIVISPSPSESTHTLPHNWLQILINMFQTDERHRVIVTNYYLKQVGESSTYTHKLALIDLLKNIYVRIMSSPAEDAMNIIIQMPKDDEDLKCTVGFHNRIQQIVQNLTNKMDLDVLVATYFEQVVDKLARNYTSDVHTHNRFFTIASELYGVRAINPLDPHARTISDDIIKRILSKGLQDRCSFTKVATFILSDIKNKIATFGYNGYRSEGYSSGVYQDIFNFLCTRISSISSHEDVFLFNKEDDGTVCGIIDIDWRKIYRALIRLQEKYFTFSDSERSLLNDERFILNVPDISLKTEDDHNGLLANMLESLLKFCKSGLGSITDFFCLVRGQFIDYKNLNLLFSQTLKTADIKDIVAITNTRGDLLSVWTLYKGNHRFLLDALIRGREGFLVNILTVDIAAMLSICSVDEQVDIYSITMQPVLKQRFTNKDVIIQFLRNFKNYEFLFKIEFPEFTSLLYDNYEAIILKLNTAQRQELLRATGPERLMIIVRTFNKMEGLLSIMSEDEQKVFSEVISIEHLRYLLIQDVDRVKSMKVVIDIGYMFGYQNCHAIYKILQALGRDHLLLILTGINVVQAFDMLPAEYHSQFIELLGLTETREKIFSLLPGSISFRLSLSRLPEATTRQLLADTQHILRRYITSYFSATKCFYLFSDKYHAWIWDVLKDKILQARITYGGYSMHRILQSIIPISLRDEVFNSLIPHLVRRLRTFSELPYVLSSISEERRMSFYSDCVFKELASDAERFTINFNGAKLLLTVSVSNPDEITSIIANIGDTTLFKDIISQPAEILRMLRFLDKQQGSIFLQSIGAEKLRCLFRATRHLYDAIQYLYLNPWCVRRTPVRRWQDQVDALIKILGVEHLKKFEYQSLIDNAQPTLKYVLHGLLISELGLLHVRPLEDDDDETYRRPAKRVCR